MKLSHSDKICMGTDYPFLFLTIVFLDLSFTFLTIKSGSCGLATITYDSLLGSLGMNKSSLNFSCSTIPTKRFYLEDI